jgi:hypothetical protein
MASALCMSFPAVAASDAELEQIRAQLKELRAQYEARIQALEARLQQAESKMAASPPSPVVAAAPAPAPASSPEPMPAPAAGSGSNLAAFNPAISAILTGTYAHLSRNPADYRIAGFGTGSDIGPGKRGFGIGESELVFSASVDPSFSGTLITSITPDDRVGVEEAYGLWNTAPFGLTPKFGRFLSGIGYLNEQHPHAWDFVDAPLAYQAFLNNRFGTDGVQVKWIAPIEHFVELGAEVGNGSNFPGSERDSNKAGSTAFYAHTGGDIGDSHSWRAGLSTLRVQNPDEQLDGKRDTAIADFVWKYAPHGNVRETNVKVQGEYFKRSQQSGWYVQGVYQWHPEWRAGLRFDRLDPGDDFDFKPRRVSAMVDYNPSEFSRFRLQFARNETVPGVVDNQWFVQYILSLGAHGAHKY